MAQAPDNSPIKPEAQRRYWNAWNARFRLGTAKLPETSSRQARIIIEWLKGIGKRESNILEIGCGTGWLCVQLAEFGRVTGIDISDEVLGKTATGVPNITFVAGDFLHLELPVRQFDVIVTLEVLSHVADQTAFIEKIASLLRPGGYLALTTQNRIALSRCSNVQPLAEGQIRQWVDANTLRPMLSRHFELLEFNSTGAVDECQLEKLLEALHFRDLAGIVRTLEFQLFEHSLARFKAFVVAVHAAGAER